MENSRVIYNFEKNASSTGIQTIIEVTIFIGLIVGTVFYFQAKIGQLSYAIIAIAIIVWLLLLISSFCMIIKGGNIIVRVDESGIKIEEPGYKVSKVSLNDISGVVLKKRITKSGDSSRCYLILKDGKEIWLYDFLGSLQNKNYHSKEITKSLETLNPDLALKRIKVDNF